MCNQDWKLPIWRFKKIPPPRNTPITIVEMIQTSQLFSWYYSTVTAQPETSCYFLTHNGIILDGCQGKFSSPGLSLTPCLSPFRCPGLWLILVPERQWLSLGKAVCTHSFLSSLLASHFEMPSAYKTRLLICLFSLFLVQNSGFWKKLTNIYILRNLNRLPRMWVTPPMRRILSEGKNLLLPPWLPLTENITIAIGKQMLLFWVLCLNPGHLIFCSVS